MTRCGLVLLNTERQLLFERQEHRFLRHDLEARRHVERVAERLRLSNRDRTWLTRITRHHLLFPEQLATGAALRRMIQRVGRDILEDVIEVAGRGKFR